MLKKMMRHTAIAVTLAVAAIPVTTGAQSGSNTPAGGGEGIAHNDFANGCFNFGAGQTQFSTCVSSHGNVSSFRTQNSEHIQAGTPAEGYIVCAVVGGVARVYHDTMWSESGFGAASTTSPGALP